MSNPEKQDMHTLLEKNLRHSYMMYVLLIPYNIHVPGVEVSRSDRILSEYATALESHRLSRSFSQEYHWAEMIQNSRFHMKPPLELLSLSLETLAVSGALSPPRPRVLLRPRIMLPWLLAGGEP